MTRNYLNKADRKEGVQGINPDLASLANRKLGSKARKEENLDFLSAEGDTVVPSDWMRFVQTRAQANYKRVQKTPRKGKQITTNHQQSRIICYRDQAILY